MNNLFVSVFHTGLMASILLAFALAYYVRREEQHARATTLARRNVASPFINQACHGLTQDTAYPADLYDIVIIDLTGDGERLLYEIEGR